MMPKSHKNLIDARAAREAAIASHENGMARLAWLNKARKKALDIYKTKGSVTVNDVRDAIEPPPECADPRIFGAVFSKKGWRRVGYRTSARKVCHARPIAVFGWVGE